MKIKVKLFNPECRFVSIAKGEWNDLRAAETIEYPAPYANRLCKSREARTLEFNQILLPLGIGMKLPKGYEAIIAPRSSSYKKFGFIQSNHIGVIDHKFFI